MIDCHCHMLPGIDDGSKNMDYSVEMARIAVNSGISDTVLTPHHMNGAFRNSRSEIICAMELLRTRLKEEDISLNLYPGSEVHLVPEILEATENGDLMTFNDKGSALLVELPKHSVPVGTTQILENLLYQGISPVIAHPERNTALRQRESLLAEWVEMGCYAQLTTNSCAGGFGDRMKQICKRWCASGWIHLIASDAHRIEGRAPDMQEGYGQVERWFGSDYAQILTEKNPRNLIEGRELEKSTPNRAIRHKWWRLFS